MRDIRAVAAIDDLSLLVVAVFAFSLFFASLAGSYVARRADDRTRQLQDAADSLLAAVMDGPRWTVAHGLLVASALDRISASDLAGRASGHPFRVVIWDLETSRIWTLSQDVAQGTRRTAATSASVLGD